MSEIISPLAGKPVPAELLINTAKFENAYYDLKPDISNPAQLVSFGTSGHRGTSTDRTFNEMHVAAITQAVCEYRKDAGIKGPLLMGMDTHLLSKFAQDTALEVLLANNLEVWIQEGRGYTPTPAISHGILNFNRNHKGTSADGMVITPSHNPPSNAGIKYNPPHGGPAESKVTGWIEKRANEILKENNSGVRKTFPANSDSLVKEVDFAKDYINDLETVLDMKVIAASGLSIGVHPLGGASVNYWEPIAEKYGLNLKVVDNTVDPTFKFMTVDHDGKVRMDCSSPYAMASLISLKDKFDIAFGTDPDADRHGIVTKNGGLMNPNHYLAVAIQYLIANRAEWKKDLKIGKTIVSSLLINDVAARLDREVYEVPVGFKWYAEGLFNGSLAFGGEESAGASFLCKDGHTPWSTDKDGLIMGLLAAEITAKTGKDPYLHLQDIAKISGLPAYSRIDAPTTPEIKQKILEVTPEMIKMKTLGGDEVISVETKAPGNNASLGGFKINTKAGWIAIRPSGTEAQLKTYGESRKNEAHLLKMFAEAAAFLPSLL